jgi:TusE/DsrC/DsvC family sulfur relay protein
VEDVLTAVKDIRKAYEVDEDGFLLDFDQWDDGFATETARKCGITSGLTDSHWRIIRWIRRHVQEFGVCPLADRTCRANGLQLGDLRELFPCGYLRGACRIAGITYDQGVRGPLALPQWASRLESAAVSGPSEGVGAAGQKVFSIDVRGFLVRPEEWDEEFAIHRASEMKMPALTDRHWMVIWYLRRQFHDTGSIPTIYQTCEELDISLNQLDELFPDGYHGGAVKIAGLRSRTGRGASQTK